MIVVRSLCNMILVALFLALSSCSKRIMEGLETHKLHDACFILRKNGYYSIKVLVMGTMRMPDGERGRYIRSNDTIYLVKRKGKDLFEATGYAVIDSFANTLTYYPGYGGAKRVFGIGKMPIRSNYKDGNEEK